MLQNPCKTLGFKKNMVYKIPPWGGGKTISSQWPKSTNLGNHELVTSICKTLKNSENVLVGNADNFLFFFFFFFGGGGGIYYACMSPRNQLKL